MNLFAKPGVLKRGVTLFIELIALILNLAFLIPLFITQANTEGFEPYICAMAMSFIGSGLAVLIAAFIFFVYAKLKFRVKKRIELFVTLFARFLCFSGLLFGHFPGGCSAAKWLESSNQSTSWFAIAVFVFLILFSFKDISMLKNDPEEAVYSAFEEAEHFMKSQERETFVNPAIQQNEEKASNDENVIEAEVVDKED